MRELVESLSWSNRDNLLLPFLEGLDRPHRPEMSNTTQEYTGQKI